jgi:3-oxoacyl-[acyl-carrier protein] reductase
VIKKLTAIITGSGRGIGKETAILLAKREINVVICSRTENEINSVVQEIKEIHNRHQGVIGIKFGGIDILINNADIVFIKKLISTSEEEWDRIININLKGAFLFTKAVLPYMISKKSGVIINVSSGAGKAGFENLSAYCASKFGMMGLTASVAWEVANHNIRVMTICPGEVDTKMQEDVDSRYYKLNKNKMLKPQIVAEKILQMILDDEVYGNGESVDI